MRELTAKELRIGNYVYADTGLPSLETHKLQPNDFIDLLNGKLKGLIKPIKLTEDWLIRFGAIKHFDTDNYLISDSEGNEFVISLDGSFGKYNEWLNDPIEWICFEKFYQVHLFQNGWKALTNEELTLKD